MDNKLRSCWGNCGVLNDKSLLEDKEISAIDAIKDCIVPLDDNTVHIRELITRFSSCYHEADKEAEMIIHAIASGQPPVESNERPPERKRDLQNSLNILSAWYDGDVSQCTDLDVGGIPADELLSFLGEQNSLKTWQVQRLIEKLKGALDRTSYYHNMELDIDGYGKPLKINLDDHYKDHLDFLKQTRTAMIHFIFEGEEDQMSLALAIDLFRPCNWNYVNNFKILLQAIGGNLNPVDVFAPCCFNKKLTPLRGRLKTLSNTLNNFCEGKEMKEDVDGDILALLGTKTEQKHWLAASFDKTIRIQQGL